MLFNGQHRVAIETHGCKLNQADSQVLARQFHEEGFHVVPISESVDVYIINSCTVTHVADGKARHSIRYAKKRNPRAAIVVTGCYAQRSPDALDSMSQIDLVIGNVDKPLIVSKVCNLLQGPPLYSSATRVNSVKIIPSGRKRAMVKIQEGCNQVCAYCIVPKVRGRERSIPIDSVVEQINLYISLGHREIVLTGTQLGTYGFEYKNVNLTTLISEILSKTSIERLRISSLQPQEITPELLDLWSNNRLCPHFHIPLQSGSNDILARMRRRYTNSDYCKAVKLVRQEVANVSITTDVIVGFPSESDEDFQQTFELCKHIEFSSIHTFPYSKRPGTSGFHFDGQVLDTIKSCRVKVMLDLSSKLSQMYRKMMDGQIRAILWEESEELAPGIFRSVGLTDNYIRTFTRGRYNLENQIIHSKLSLRPDGSVHANTEETVGRINR